MPRRRKPGHRNQIQQRKALLLHARGDAKNNKGEPLRQVVVTLPAIRGPSLAEIEQKYGPLT